jgi:lipid II:glycine glycyltransferase (peptidoglycan interpeptide bridge formation enzyme)
LFEQPWWLDAVAPGAWGAAEVWRGGRVVARLPYVTEKRLGLIKGLNMPPLTQTLGPWLAPLEGKQVEQLARQKELMTELIEGLPPHDYFHERFHYSVGNWLPFYWRGFEQTTRYTYEIEALDDLDRVWDRFHKSTRKNVRKAQKHVAVRTDLGIERFMDINALSFERQGLKVPYSRNFVRRLDEACAKREARRIYFAEDAQGRIHAAQYIVWDGVSAHAIAAGSDPDFRDSYAHALLHWEAIQFAATVTRRYNFGGSIIEPIERFVRDFGGTPQPYFRLTRMSRRMRFLMGGRDMVRALLGKDGL